MNDAREYGISVRGDTSDNFIIRDTTGGKVPSIEEIDAQIAKLQEQRQHEIERQGEGTATSCTAAVEKLRGFGWTDQDIAKRIGLTVKFKAMSGSKGTGKTRTRDPNKPCDICKFVTSPPHDGRKHRSQGENKKPFTDAELSAQEMARV